MQTKTLQNVGDILMCAWSLLCVRNGWGKTQGETESEKKESAHIVKKRRGSLIIIIKKKLIYAFMSYFFLGV